MSAPNTLHPESSFALRKFEENGARLPTRPGLPFYQNWQSQISSSYRQVRMLWKGMTQSKADLRACSNCGIVFTANSKRGAFGKCPNCVSSAIEAIKDL